LPRKWTGREIMRTAIALSVGVGVMLVTLLIRLLRRKPPSSDVGAVSRQWIAEQSSKSDQPWL
jgi:hypothetical protein